MINIQNMTTFGMTPTVDNGKWERTLDRETLMLKGNVNRECIRLKWDGIQWMCTSRKKDPKRSPGPLGGSLLLFRGTRLQIAETSWDNIFCMGRWQRTNISDTEQKTYANKLCTGFLKVVHCPASFLCHQEGCLNF